MFSCVNGVSTFNPDVPDFAVQQIVVSEADFELNSVESASITIVTSGKAKCGQSLSLEAGTVFYADANETLKLKIEQPLTAYRAFVA